MLDLKYKFHKHICLYGKCMTKTEYWICSYHRHKELDVIELIKNLMKELDDKLNSYRDFFINIGNKALSIYGEVEIDVPEYKWYNTYEHFNEGSIMLEEIESFEYGPFRVSLIDPFAMFTWDSYTMYMDKTGKRIFMDTKEKCNIHKQVLGIESLNETVINKTYRKVALIHHPDRNGDPVMFDKITKARDYLLGELNNTNKITGHFSPSYYAELPDIPDPDLNLLQNLFPLIRDKRFYELLLKAIS